MPSAHMHLQQLRFKFNKALLKSGFGSLKRSGIIFGFKSYEKGMCFFFFDKQARNILTQAKKAT